MAARGVKRREKRHRQRVFAIRFEMSDLQIVRRSYSRTLLLRGRHVQHDRPKALSRQRSDDRAVDRAIIQNNRQILGHSMQG